MDERQNDERGLIRIVSLTIEKEPIETFMVSEKMLYQFRNGVLTDCETKPSYEEAVKYVLDKLEKRLTRDPDEKDWAEKIKIEFMYISPSISDSDIPI